jgi:hypothetical protein
MRILVDLIGYEDAYEGGYHENNRRFDYANDFVEMDITPQQLKEFIDKGIDIKLITN